MLFMMFDENFATILNREAMIVVIAKQLPKEPLWMIPQIGVATDNDLSDIKFYNPIAPMLLEPPTAILCTIS